MNKVVSYVVLTAIVSLILGGSAVYLWSGRSSQNTKVVFRETPAAAPQTTESKRETFPENAIVKQTVPNPWSNTVAFLVSENVGLSKNVGDVLSRYSVYVLVSATGELRKLYELPVTDLEKIHSGMVSLEWKDETHLMFDMTDYITGGEKLEFEVK